MEFVSHVWNLLALRNVEVLATIQPKIECLRYADNSAGRKRLAEDCYDSVLGRFTGNEFGSDGDGESIDERPPTSFFS